ncbi:MAG: ATP-binding protein [Paludibacteraceae bacterium]
MLQWKRTAQGRTALLIEGARRVGKSTLVRTFAEKEYTQHLIVDFSRVAPQVVALFDDLEDLNLFYLKLQAHYGIKLTERQAVIVFDEVQLCPRARQAIKHLVADGRYDFIETGSLISIQRNIQHIIIPSEERRLELLPLDFEEFCWALGDTATMDLLHQFFEQRQPLQNAHRAVMRKLRLYMLVGGMPQAVNAYLQENNLQDVDAVKRDIILLYLEDFHKIDPLGRLTAIFKSIPAQLNANYKRYYPTTAVGDVKADKVAENLFNLSDSKTINVAYHANDPQVGLPLNASPDRYKLFVADTGLFVTLAFWDKAFTDNIIYRQLLLDKLPANLGYVYENLVAQMLRSSGNRLFYYTWQKDAKHYYEIDFLLSRGNKIVPLEVKASGYKTHVSLDAFCTKFSSRVGARYLLYTKDVNKDAATQLLPIYMAGLL